MGSPPIPLPLRRGVGVGPVKQTSEAAALRAGAKYPHTGAEATYTSRG